MTTYNTGNPYPSSAARDIFDDTQTLEGLMLLKVETIKNRFGENLYTAWFFSQMVANANAQIGTTVSNAQAQVNSTRDSAIVSINSTRDAANAEMLQTAAELGDDLNNKYYQGPTAFEDMLADPQNRDSVTGIVDGDEDPERDGWYYWSQALQDWKRFLDQPASSERTVPLFKTEKQDAEKMIAIIADDNGVVPLAFDENGDAHVGDIEFETRDISSIGTSDGERILFPITDEAGNIVFGFRRRDGTLICHLASESYGISDPGGLARMSPANIRVDGLPVVSGLSLVMSGVKLSRFGITISVPDVAITAATEQMQTVNPYTLKYIAGVSHPVRSFQAIDAAAWLGYSSVSIISVTRNSDGVALNQGTQFAWSENGKIAGMINTADQAVTVNFTGRRERYDVVVFNTQSQSVMVRQGTERPITAHEDLYRGQPQAGDVPLFSVYVVGNSIREVIPVWNWRGPRNITIPGVLEGVREKCRTRLSRLRRKLSRGEGVIVTGYGDSTTACGAGAYASEADYLPNRAGVDTVLFQGAYYNAGTPEQDYRETVAASMPTVTVNGQVRYKASALWRVLDAIQVTYGHQFVSDKIPAAGELVYLNQSIGGSNASTAAGGGANPARLAATIAPAGFRKPDLVIVGFGMNSGLSGTYASNLSAIISALKAQDIDVLVWGPYGVNPNGTAYTLENWRRIQQMAEEVAEFHEVAYVPMSLYSSGEMRGWLGISDYSLTRTNWINHPGLYEQRMLGKLLAELVI